MKTLSTVASEYRGIWVEERGSELVISSCVFFLLCDSPANQDPLQHRKSLLTRAAFSRALGRAQRGPGLAACWTGLAPRREVKSGLFPTEEVVLKG